MQEAVKDPEAKKRLDDIYGIGKPASATLSDRHKRLLTDLVGWQTHVLPKPTSIWRRECLPRDQYQLGCTRRSDRLVHL